MQVKHYNNSQFLTVYMYNEDEADKITDDNTRSDLFVPAFSPELEKFLQHIEKETGWCKYLLGCLQSWNQETLVPLQVSNAAHGVVGELAEVLTSSIDMSSSDAVIDELGDLLYYRTIFAFLMGIDLDLRPTKENVTEGEIWSAISNLCDVGKKVGFHHKFNNEKTYNRTFNGLAVVDTFIKDTLEFYNHLTLDDVMQLNLAKLSKRHSQGKFNPNY